MEPKELKQKLMNPESDVVIENVGLSSMEGPMGHNVMDDLEELNEPTRRHLMSEPAPGNDLNESDELPDMEPRVDEYARLASAPVSGQNAASFAATEQGEGYLRLVVSVNELTGEMHVTDASVVAGELVQEDLTGEMAYQVLLHGKRIGSGAFVDLSTQCGFAPPDDHEGLGHHHCAKLSEYEFVVRIPRSEITVDELEQLEVELVRPETTTSLSSEFLADNATDFASASSNVGRKAPKVIARMKGLKLDDLPSKASAAIKKSLR